MGCGDFTQNHGKNLEKYNSLSRTGSTRRYNDKFDIKILISENYRGSNGFFANNYDGWRKVLKICSPG